MSQHKQQQCCVLGVCCGRSAQQAAVSHALVDAGLDPAAAGKAATWLVDTFDIAPHGTIKPLMRAMLEAAQERAGGPPAGAK